MKPRHDDLFTLVQNMFYSRQPSSPKKGTLVGMTDTPPKSKSLEYNNFCLTFPFSRFMLIPWPLPIYLYKSSPVPKPYLPVRLFKWSPFPLRCTLLILAVQSMGGTWILEQPRSSEVLWHPRVRLLWRLLPEVRWCCLLFWALFLYGFHAAQIFVR